MYALCSKLKVQNAAVAELADAQDLKSNGWIVKLWQIFLEKSRILKFHI